MTHPFKDLNGDHILDGNEILAALNDPKTQSAARMLLEHMGAGLMADEYAAGNLTDLHGSPLPAGKIAQAVNSGLMDEIRSAREAGSREAYLAIVQKRHGEENRYAAKINSGGAENAKRAERQEYEMLCAEKFYAFAERFGEEFTSINLTEEQTIALLNRLSATVPPPTQGRNR